MTAEDCAACHRFPQLGQYSEGNLPADFDWRALGAVTSVKNQGYCGSCWSFSTAADVEGAYFLKTGKLTSLSNQQMVECSTQNYGCGGGYVWHAMQYVEHVGGLVSYDELPNKMVDMYDVMSVTSTPTCDKAAINADVQSSVETPWNTSSVAAITGFQMVAMGASFEELMRVALLKNGPISITLNANGMDFYHHGVVWLASAAAPTARPARSTTARRATRRTSTTRSCSSDTARRTARRSTRRCRTRSRAGSSRIAGAPTGATRLLSRRARRAPRGIANLRCTRP